MAERLAEKIVVNCIGLGHWGPNLVRNFISHPEVAVGAVCDVSEERLALVENNIPGISRLSTDPAATAADPAADAVVIATPVESHFELAQAALAAGKHVLVEKPLCDSLAEGEKLVALAQEQGVHLSVGHVFLFNNGVRGVRNLIRSGELGRIRYVYSNRTNLGPFRSDVNAFWDLASHDLSILNHWLDAEPVSVTARGECYLSDDVEDVVLASYAYPGQVMASVHASWLNPRKVREITVVGEHKMVVWSDMDLNEPIRIYNKSVGVERAPVYSDSFGSFRMQVHTGDVVIPHIAGAEPLASECGHFVDCIRGRCTPVNDGTGALAVLRALEAADRSMRSNSIIVPVSAGPATVKLAA